MALQTANAIRTKRARLKDEVKSGRMVIIPLIEETPKYLETMKLHELLLTLPKVGRVKANKILAKTRISPVKTLGGLSPRQRAEVVDLLKRM